MNVGGRQITGVAGGNQATDAVNVRQLQVVDDRVTATNNNLAVTNGNLATTNNNLATTNTNLSNLTTGINTGTIGLVQQDGGAPGQGRITIGANTGGTLISVAGTAGARTVTGVAPGLIAAGSTETINGGQVAGIDQRVTNNTETLNFINNGGGIKYFRTNSTLADSAAIGGNSVAIGPNAQAQGASSISIGANSVASNTNSLAIGTGNKVSGISSGAFGDPNTVSGTGSYAFGNDNLIPTDNTFVVGNNVNTTGAGNGNVVLGNASTIAAPSGAVYATATPAPASQVSIGSAGAERRITNVAGGTVPTDAVNVAQLNQIAQNTVTALGGGSAYNAANGAYTPPTYVVGGAPYTNVGTAIAAENAIVTQQGTTVASTFGGTTTYNPATGTVGGSQFVVEGVPYNNVTSALDATNKSITNIVNGQSGPFRSDNTAKAAAPVASGANAIAAGFGATSGGSRSTVVGNSASDGNVANSTVLGNGASVIAGVTGSNVALGQASTVAASPIGTAGTVIGTMPYIFAGAVPVGTVSVGFQGQERTITNVAAGRVAATSTDATNGSQLFAVYDYAATLNANVDGGKIGVVQRSGTLNDVVITAPGGTGTAPGVAQTLSNVAPGVLTAASLQGVNGGQINTLGTSIANNFGGKSEFNPLTGKVSSPTYTINNAPYTDVGSAFDAIDKSISGGAGIKYFHANSTLGDSTAVGTDSVAVGPLANAGGVNSVAMGKSSVASAPNSMALGADANASAANSVALGQASVASRGALTGYTAFGLSAVQNSVGEVSVGAAGAARQLTNVAAGTQVQDAVNLGQLQGAVNGLGSSITNVLGGTYNTTTGAYTGPTYNTYGGTTATTVQGAFDNYNNQITTIVNGGTGPVQYSNVATPTTPNGGTKTNDVTLVGATTGPVALHNVANGLLTAKSTDAVNGSQVNALGTSIATNLGGGSKFDEGSGTVTAPKYELQGGTYTNVGAALGALDTATTNNTTAITNISNGTSGIVRQVGTAPGAGVLTVGAQTQGTKVDFTNSEGVNRVLGGVGEGELSATSKEGVNGSQLFATNEVIRNINNGGGIKYFHSNSTGADSQAVGTDSVAAGPTAVANGTGSVAVGSGSSTGADAATALGQGATAKAANSVALGAGSVADRGSETYRPSYYNNGAVFTSAGTVSVGSEGAERIVANVAPGVRDTDAANVGQVKGLQANVDRSLATMKRGFNRAIASTAALSFQPVQQHPGQFVVSAGVGHFDGENAIGFGGNYLFESGRQKLYAGIAGSSGGKPVIQVGFSAAFGD